ncbi:MAG: MATE family efflux transporter [Gemmatimonadetes bacterium]|nr:MATE family efflux transporter [Gemmatimonadota bacterium]MBI3567346.1 MATE family efflux transporter [Gemmatimonadota bacterium]
MSESLPDLTIAVPASRSWWRDVRDAARGSKHDYTSGDIGRAIFLLAVPMVLEMIMEGLFAVADVFWVGRLGSDAVATVGLTETMMIIVYTVGIGLSISGAAYVARRVGEKNHDGAARGAVQAIILGAALSAVMAVAGAVFAPDLLALMGASPSVIASGSGFTRVMLGGSSTAFLLFIINATFRGAGDAAVAMRVLWLANWINIVLGPLLIFGVGPFPAMGVRGAAVATTIGRGVGVLFALTRLARGSGHLAVKRRHLTVEWHTIWQLIRMSVNATFQFTVSTVSWIGLVRVMASFGSVAMAGYTISVRIMMLALMPAWGLSSAAATMLGQALGAQNPDRAATAVKTAARYNVMFLGSVGALFLIGAPWLIAAFTHDPAVQAVGTFGLRTMALGFPMFALGMVYTQAFNGAGDTWTPTWINLFVFWMFEIPLAWVLARHTPVGYRGIFIAVAVAYSSLALVSRALFARGRWRTRKV